MKHGKVTIYCNGVCKLSVLLANLTIVPVFQSIRFHQQSYEIQLPSLTTILPAHFYESIAFIIVLRVVSQSCYSRAHNRKHTKQFTKKNILVLIVLVALVGGGRSIVINRI